MLIDLVQLLCYKTFFIHHLFAFNKFDIMFEAAFKKVNKSVTKLNNYHIIFK